MRTPSEGFGTTLSAAPDPAAERDEALCRSILYEALAIGFRFPSAETERLTGAEGNAALADAARRAGGPDLADRALELARRGHPLAALEAEYQRIFGHSVRGGVSLFETEYGGGTLFQQPQELADLAGFLRAFGLVRHPAVRERLDHVACECEFLLVLARREARNLEAGARDPGQYSDRLQITRDAQRKFHRDHLGRFGPALAAGILRADPEGFYGALAEILRDFLVRESSRLGLAPGTEALPLRGGAEDGAPMACGGDEGLVQIESPGRGGR